MEKEGNRVEVSRRNFVGLMSAAALAAGAGLVGCSSESNLSETGETTSDSADPDAQWAGEADVIVMGFGGAGATAAVEAARKGANVIVFEKAPEEFCGGNSSVSEGCALIGSDREGAFQAARRTTTATSVTDEEIYAFIDNTTRMADWLDEAVGLKVEVTDTPGNWGSLDLGSGFGQMFFAPTFFQSVKAAAEGLPNLQIFYETPVTDLVIDDASGEVRGVTVKNADGSTSSHKALKGVVMACGSFEASGYYIENYCYDPLPELYPLGTPYNTGDGIAIAQKAGARMRHMAGLEFGAYCFRQPSQEMGTTIAMNNRWGDLDHLVAVNKNGKRFMNEAGATQAGALPHPGHDKTTFPELAYDGIAFEYTNLPFWFVFDSERFAHSLGTWADSSATSGWTTRHGLYVWSEDNSAEIEKGWILKADTLADLASQMGVDAAALEATIDEYNKGCESGADAFGRTESLTPVAKGPFYATDMALAFINAQGGPERNENYQVIGSNSEPIPRLYAAGEFGSIWGHDYHGGVNVPEAICGFAAGEQVADLEPWA